MKGALFAAAALAGSVSAGVHKMPLKKVSLSEQLAGANIDTHVKHLGQKYMGVRPQSHADEMFKDTALHADGGAHPVPVSNFLNAQCKLLFNLRSESILTKLETSPRSLLVPHHKPSRSCSTPEAPTCGFHLLSVDRSRATCTLSTIHHPHQHSKRTVPHLKSDMALVA
jgi:hypothetical protein